MNANLIIKINNNEIKRVNDLISINSTELKTFFEDDICLIKTNPCKYWNSFMMLSGDNSKRSKLIKSVQSYYMQLKLEF